MPLAKRTYLLPITDERVAITVSIFITELLVKLLLVEGEWLRKMWYIYIMQYYGAIKMDSIEEYLLI